MDPILGANMLPAPKIGFFWPVVSVGAMHALSLHPALKDRKGTAAPNTNTKENSKAKGFCITVEEGWLMGSVWTKYLEEPLLLTLQ